MKITNRILSAAAAACMAFTVFLHPEINLHGKYSDNVLLTANAKEYKTDALELNYINLDDGTVEITKYISSASTDIEIPSIIDGKKVTSIGNEAFGYCSELESITIPDGVTSIGSNTFRDCDALRSIIIPDSITSIGDGAFGFCRALESITIPDNVESIGVGVFEGCRSLSDIIVNENNNNYSDIDGVLFDKTQSKLICHPEGKYDKAYVIPDSVTIIDEYSFFDCSRLTSITIPDGVTIIGHAAFWGCSYLTSVTLPDGVTNIDALAFRDCRKLTSITIPDSVTSIGNFAFCDCSSLTSITIPERVTSIGKSTFENCSALTSVTISDSVTCIGDFAFSGCSGLTSITIPDSVTSIEWYAFRDCSGLTSVTIPKSVTSIGYGAFEDCSALTSIIVKNPDCEFYDSNYTISENAAIYGYKNSTAQEYAEKYGIKFVELSDNDDSFKIADLVILQKWIINGEKFADWEKYDLCKDNQLNAFDLCLLRKILIENTK